MEIRIEEGSTPAQNPPPPTLADVPLLPRRRLRDGTTSQSHTIPGGSCRSSRGSSIASSSRSSSTSRSQASVNEQSISAGTKKRRSTRGGSVQRLRGGMTRSGGNKEDAVEIGSSDDEIELVEMDGAGSSSFKQKGKRPKNDALTDQENSSTSQQVSQFKTYSTSHLPTTFQEYASTCNVDHPNESIPRLWSLTHLFSPPSASTSASSGRYAMIILNQPITRDDVFRRAWKASTSDLLTDKLEADVQLDPSERESYLPDMIKGDLDSLRDDVRSFYSNLGVEVKQDPSQDSTDLMKCIEEIESREKESSTQEQIPILLIGGLSGRVDQTVHTMSLLHKLRKKRDEVYVLNGESVAWVLDEGSHLIDIDHKTMGQTCAPMPIGVENSIIQTKGLKWDIDDESSMFGLMSTSNHLLPENPAVWLKTSRPILWCIEIKDSLPPIV